MGYMGNFVVYLMAMLGIIVIALWVYKKFNVSGLGFKNNNSLKVEDTLSLTPRKTLYVIRNGKERFLIAGDFERTTLISKLKDSEELPDELISEPIQAKRSRRIIKRADLSENNINIQDNLAPIKKPIMKEIRTKLNF